MKTMRADEAKDIAAVAAQIGGTLLPNTDQWFNRFQDQVGIVIEAIRHRTATLRQCVGLFVPGMDQLSEVQASDRCARAALQGRGLPDVRSVYLEHVGERPEGLSRFRLGEESRHAGRERIGIGFMIAYKLLRVRKDKLARAAVHQSQSCASRSGNGSAPCRTGRRVSPFGRAGIVALGLGRAALVKEEAVDGTRSKSEATRRSTTGRTVKAAYGTSLGS